MGLASYQPARHELVMSEGSVISVTGLSLNHISRLIHHHFQDIEALFAIFEKHDQVHSGDLEHIFLGLIQDAPGFVANVIALAAGEPDEAEKAQGLPFPVQIQLLTSIADLTFRDVGGPKKALEMVTSLLVKAREAQIPMPKNIL